jgi:amidase
MAASRGVDLAANDRAAPPASPIIHSRGELMRSSGLAAGLLLLGVFAHTAYAETYRYVPTTFYNPAAGGSAALRIKTGDRVVTTTVDDLGAGADLKGTSEGGATLTGPFFVDGAEPGDLLVVTIEKLTPNRAIGYSTSLMSEHAIAKGGLDGRPDPARLPWTIDSAAGVVRLDLHQIIPNTDWASRFSSPVFTLPLQPMLASIGVAPPAGASTAAGSFGGDMTAGVVTAGTRVMLPVYQSGALLYLGHGHARQGDGHITGSGIETSLDVEFSVDVVKKKEWPHSSVVRPSTVVGEFEQGWPRIETATSLMTVASGPSLGDALQRATLELHHWLDDDFGLSEKTVSIFLGQAMEYEVANVAGSSCTIVAKVTKSYLPKPVAAN